MVGVILSSTCFALLLAYYIPSPRPQGLLITMSGSAFPAINILVATAFYGFILFWINNKYFFITNILRSIFFVILGLSGLAAIYLNDYWFIDVITAYFAGAAICLSAYLIYRKNNFNTLKDNQPGITLCLLFAGIISATSLSSYLNFQELSYAHTPYNKEFTLNKSLWWNQKKPILPLYQLSRIGNKISLLNIQYAGDLQSLKDDLGQQGWKTHTESFVTKLLMRINNKATDIKLPLLAQLYQNKRPQLIMTYKVKESSLILILTIWESNYTIHELNKPIWIGSVHQNFRGKEKESSALKNQEKLINPVTYLLPALKDYTVRRIALPPTLISNSTFPTTSMIFLIKEIDK